MMSQMGMEVYDKPQKHVVQHTHESFIALDIKFGSMGICPIQSPVGVFALCSYVQI